MTEQDRQKDKEYYAARDGLFKLASHPGIGPDLSSRIIKHLRDKRTEEMLTWLDKQPEVKPGLKKVELPKKEDLGLSLEELKSARLTLPHITEVTSEKERESLMQVYAEQEKIILSRPPTFGQRLRNWPSSRGFRKTIFWGGVSINTIPGTVGTIGRTIGLSELGLQMQYGQVAIYTGEIGLVIFGLAGLLAIAIGGDILTGVYKVIVGSEEN